MYISVCNVYSIWWIGPDLITITHLHLVPHIRDSKLGQHRFRYGLVACSAPCHYRNQCWLAANWTLGNKLQRNPNRNSKIFIQEMRLKMSLAKWRPFCPGGDELMVQGNITSPYLRDLNHTKRGDKMEMYATKRIRIPRHFTEVTVSLSGTQCSPIGPPRSLKEVLVFCTDIDLEIVMYNAFMSHM